MANTLSELFSGLELTSVKGSLDRTISGMVIDSRRVTPGSLFFALPGLRSDGSFFIDEAIARGAVAVVSEKSRQLVPGNVTFIRVADPRTALAEVARRFFDAPDQAIELIGVTGTNGKTTVTHLVKHLLSSPEERVGLIGTIQYDLGMRTVPSFKTTPESLDIYGMLHQIRNAGCHRAVMEVSSHGIDQRRVSGMHFSAAVFTNLTRDHLDYHGTLEDYFQVKARLFTGQTGALPKVAAVNIDDPFGRRLVDMVPSSVRLVTFGTKSDAEIRATDIVLGFTGSRFRLVWPEGSEIVSTDLLGLYNVNNLLAALAVCYGLGYHLPSLLAKLENFPVIPGRMEKIDTGRDYNVLVDYAHTDDALKNALGMLRAITPGRLLVVFGCGGNRDRTKRPAMARVVEEHADIAWATSDNPRKEALAQIFEDMRAGLSSPESMVFIDDRRRAISLALDEIRDGDSLLIAGKGHEAFQEFGDTVIPFDDRQVARELIAVKQINQTR